MTTDITELAQSEINDALAQLKQISEYPTPSTQYARVLRKYIATLVEALEKAQHRIDELENDEVRQRLANAEHQLYMAELAKHNLKASRKAQFRKRRAAEKRIAELEEAEQKLCAANVTLDARAELAERQLAELESRAVTVSLPDIMPPEAAPAHYWDPGESMAYADGYNKSAADLKTSFAQACSSAGVNVEFE
ncbi:TPA: hypothetical protein MEZ67_000784 [Klebsiella pneumoniae]|nr:hypothetical protein [Klebsiella pneumoniae]